MRCSQSPCRRTNTNFRLSQAFLPRFLITYYFFFADRLWFSNFPFIFNTQILSMILPLRIRLMDSSFLVSLFRQSLRPSKSIWTLTIVPARKLPVLGASCSKVRIQDLLHLFRRLFNQLPGYRNG